MARFVAPWMFVALALALVPGTAVAQTHGDCVTNVFGPLEVSPASGAPNASLDAPILVRFAEGYFGPGGPIDPPSSLFRMVSCDGCGSPCDLTSGTPVPGLVQTQGDSLIFLPDGGLHPLTQYMGEVTGMEGPPLDFNFCTATGHDTNPPTAATIGADPTSTQVSGLTCLPDGGYRIGVYFGPSTDDGPPGSIEYLLFETHGNGIDAPLLVDRVRNFQTDRITMSFLLSHEEAATPVCVQVVTVDGAGHANIPGGERCFDPVGHVTFQGCTASPGRPQNGTLGLALLVAAIALARRRG